LRANEPEQRPQSHKKPRNEAIIDDGTNPIETLNREVQNEAIRMLLRFLGWHVSRDSVSMIQPGTMLTLSRETCHPEFVDGGTNPIETFD
jgi:hypothetical protein